MTKIRCVLIQDCNLGSRDEVIWVKRGYARNYLIPNNIVLQGTESNLKIARENLRQRQQKIEKQREESLKIVKKLENITIEYKNESSIKKVSVTNADIVDLIHKTTGQELDKKNIIINEKIDKEGEYDIQVNLFNNVNAHVKLIVKNNEINKN